MAFSPNTIVTDPTTTANQANVKAASTAPTATDMALVVGLSPNGNQATAANQSTALTSLQAIDNPVGPVSPGTAGTGSFLIGGVYNTTLPTFTTGQQGAIQVDANGRQIISPLANTSVVKAELQDNAGNGLTSTTTGAKQALDVVINSPAKTTYLGATAPFSPPATPTDMVTIIGSATKTIKILRIVLTATQSTAGINTFYLKKYSTANTGTATTITSVPLDSTNAAATAVMKNYTANPTLGTLVGSFDIIRLNTPTTTGNTQPIYIWDFETGNTGQPITLRGVAEQLSVNFNNAALPTGLSINVSIKWTEE